MLTKGVVVYSRYLPLRVVSHYSAYTSTIVDLVFASFLYQGLGTRIISY
jgi:hypothetical protein